MRGVRFQSLTHIFLQSLLMKFIEISIQNGNGSAVINIDQIAYISDTEDGGYATIFIIGSAKEFKTNRPLKDIVQQIKAAAASSQD